MARKTNQDHEMIEYFPGGTKYMQAAAGTPMFYGGVPTTPTSWSYSSDIRKDNVLSVLQTDALMPLYDLLPLKQNVKLASTSLLLLQWVLSSGEKTVSSQKVTVEVTKDSEGNFEGLTTDGGDNSLTNSSDSIKSAASAYSNKFNTAGLVNSVSNINNLDTLGKIGVVLQITDVLTGKFTSIEDTIQGAAIGTVESVFAGFANKAVLSITGLTGVASLAVAPLVSMLFGELAQLALGTDNSFGFGGEYVGTDKFGNNHYSEPVDAWTGITDLVKEAVTLGRHYSHTEFNNDKALAELQEANWDADRFQNTVDNYNKIGEIGVSTLGSLKLSEKLLGLNEVPTVQEDLGYDEEVYGSAREMGFDHYTSISIATSAQDYFDDYDSGYESTQSEEEADYADDNFGDIGDGGYGI